MSKATNEKDRPYTTKELIEIFEADYEMTMRHLKYRIWKNVTTKPLDWYKKTDARKRFFMQFSEVEKMECIEKNDQVGFLKWIEKQKYVMGEESKIKEVEVMKKEAKQYPIYQLVEFNRAGFARCIWHNEKTASMKYYKNKNTVYCFGCNKKADVISVYMQLNQCSFMEAVKNLSRLLKITSIFV